MQHLVKVIHNGVRAVRKVCSLSKLLVFVQTSKTTFYNDQPRMHSTLRYSPKRKGHPKAFLPLMVNLVAMFLQLCCKICEKAHSSRSSISFFVKSVVKSDYQSNAW